MGATASTPANLVPGAGDVKIDGSDIGVTRGDNGFTVNETMFEPDDLNGVPGMLVGTQYIINQEAVLACGMPEVSAATIAKLLKGSRTVNAGGTVTIDWDGTRRVPTSAFHDYELIVPGLSNWFHFLADNALNQASAEWNAQNAEMMTPRGEFHSKWEATALTASPHRILIAPLGS